MSTETVQNKRSSSSTAAINLTSEDALRFRLMVDHIERCHCCRRTIVGEVTINDNKRGLGPTSPNPMLLDRPQTPPPKPTKGDECSITINSPDLKLNISLPGSIPTSAKTKHIGKLNWKARNALCDLYRCLDLAEQWNSLTQVQKILFEEYATIKLLELIDLYNGHVFHSMHYRLREKTLEEEEEEDVY
jgi:hypothetical protein